jgi:hypothetical protein
MDTTVKETLTWNVFSRAMHPLRRCVAGEGSWGIDDRFIGGMYGGSSAEHWNEDCPTDKRSGCGLDAKTLVTPNVAQEGEFPSASPGGTTMQRQLTWIIFRSPNGWESSICLWIRH